MSVKYSIGLLEFKTVPVAVSAVDVMLKAANVELVFAAPVCPGKYLAIVSGDVSAVKTSVEAGASEGAHFLLSAQVITNVSPDVLRAISGVSLECEIRAVGLVEFMSVITAVRAADIASKAANVRLIDVRLARGLGGKSFISVTGEVSSVKTAIKACEEQLSELGDIVSSAVISQPHPQLKKAIV